MLSVLDLAQEDTRIKKKAAKEYAGPCPDPNCGKRTDGFSVRWNGYSWTFMCRGCWDSSETLPGRDRKRGWGNEIDYLTHYRHIPLDNAILQALDDGTLSFEDAYKRYAYEKRWPYERAQKYLLELGANKDQKHAIRKSSKSFKNYSLEHTSLAWQEQVHKAVEEYTAHLWTSEGLSSLEYARGRGLYDETIRKARLGYSVQGGIPRLIIPLRNFYFHDYEGGWYFTIFRRDLRPDCPHEERWVNAKGSTSSELYMADCLRARRITVLTEGTLDALSVVQECGDIVNVVATAGVQCGQSVANLARLALMPLVLVAFDADAAGDKESKWWLERLPNARRLRPLLPDINDMLLDDWDIRAWVKRGIGISEEQETASEKQTHNLNQCFACQRLVSSFEGWDKNLIPQDAPELRRDLADGNMYCHYCRADLFEVEVYWCCDCLDQDKETAASHELDEVMYCLEHYIQRKGDTEEQFNAYVQAITDVIPGICTVTLQPRGYTLEQRVRDLEEEARQRQREKYDRLRRSRENSKKTLATV